MRPPIEVGPADGAGAELTRGRPPAVPPANPWSAPAAGIGYAAATAALVAQTWFSPGKFIAAGDTGPMLGGLSGVTRSWTDSLAASGSTGYRAAALPDAVVHDVVTGLGFSHTLAQRVWYTLVITLCVAAVAWLSAAFTRHAAATTAAGLVALLAPFHLITLPNLLPALSITAVALIGGWAVRSWDGRTVPPPAALLLALLLGPLARNPPLLVMTIGVAGLAGVAVVVHRRSALREVASCLGWTSVGSLFWFVPLALHYMTGTPGLEIVAQTDVGAWSWTHRNSGTANVLRLVASWVWGDPNSMGAVSSLSRGVWPTIGWALPLAVAASIALAVHRRAAVLLALAVGVVVVLCVGINAPFAAVNGFLYDNVPGYWLYRQPMAKFGVLLVVGYAALVAMGVDGLVVRSPAWPPRARTGALVVAAVLAVGVVAYSNPLWTGSVIHGQRGGPSQLPPERVAVPDGWYQAGEWLDDAPRDGSVAVFPLTDYYQQGTDWGFYGVNDLVARLVERPAMNLLPGGYFEPAGTVPELLTSLQAAVADGDGSSALRLMNALGVAYIAVRSDLTTVPMEPTADGNELRLAAEGIPELRVAAQFDEAQIFEASDPVDATVRRAIDAAPGLDAERLVDVVAASPMDVAVVEDDGRDGYADAWLPADGVTTHETPTADGRYHLSTRNRAPLLWTATAVRGTDGSQELQLRLRSTMTVGGTDLLPRTELSVPVDGQIVGIVVDDRPVALRDGTALFGADPGTSIGVLVSSSPVGITDPAEGTLGNCHNRTGASLAEAGIEAFAVSGGVGLRAGAGSACLAVPVPSTRQVLDSAMWHISGDFERSEGQTTRVCLWLPASSKCAAGTPPATAEASGSLDFIAATDAGEDPDGAVLMVYADHQEGVDTAPVVSEFRNLRLGAVTLADEAIVVPDAAPGSMLREYAAGGVARFTIDQELAVNMVRPMPDTVEDCYNYDDAPAEANALAARRIGTGPGATIELSARRHSACVNSPVDHPGGVRHLTVAFEYRAAGPGGRWCLRGAAASCIASASLGASDEWQQVTAEIVVPDSAPVASSDLKLYVYAEGSGPDEVAPAVRTVEYRRISVRATYPLVGVIQPVRSDADSEHVAVLTEAFAAGWSPTGPDAEVAASHQLVDGWANGWIVPRGYGSEMDYRYGPDRLVALAFWSLPLVMLLAATSLVRSHRTGRPAKPTLDRSAARPANPHGEVGR